MWCSRLHWEKLVYQLEFRNLIVLASEAVAAAQESQRNLIFTAWFSSFTPAWFFTRFDLTNNLVETISRSVVLKDCYFNFVDWTKNKSLVIIYVQSRAEVCKASAQSYYCC